MTTITPPIAPQPPPVTPAVAPVVVVQSPPAALGRLAVGQLLEATVTAQIAKDVFQVQTPMGQLSLQTALALPKGAALVLQLQSQSPAVQFQINSLNGAPPPHAQRTGNAAALASGIAAKGAAKANGPGQSTPLGKLAPGNVLQATVLRPLSQTSPQSLVGSPPSLSSATAGLTANKGNLNSQIGQTGVAPAQSKTSAIPKSGIANTPAANRLTGGIGNPNIQNSPSGGTSRASGFLPPGSKLSVRITGVQLPNPAAASTTPAAPGGLGTSTTLAAGTSLSGSVTGSTPSGHPIVQTRAGVFALATQTVVPRGSTVTLDVVNAPTPPSFKPGAQSTLHESLFTSRKWPALEQVIQALHEANPATAQQLVNSIIPRPDAGLTAGLIFFLTALRGGDLRSLIGDAPMRLIERNRPNLAGRVTEDFTALSRMADEPSSGDWRVALIPINTGAQIEQIRMLMRQHGSEDEEDTGSSDTRFVLDVELSVIGRLQLDGLVRNNGKSLDLIIRSEKPLNNMMHDDIRTIFLDAANLTGLKGGVNFQAAPAHFIDIPDPSGDHALGLVV